MKVRTFNQQVLTLVALAIAAGLILLPITGNSQGSETWARMTLTGTGLSAESPASFVLIQDKPDPLYETQIAKMFWTLSYGGVFATVTYEKYTGEKKTPRQHLDSIAKLFAGNNKSTLSLVTDTTFAGQPAALFEEEFFEPYEKKNTRRKMLAFGSPGEFTTINVSYPIDSPSAKTIAERVYNSVKMEGTITQDTPKMPPTDWQRLQLKGLYFETPTSVAEPQCRERFLTSPEFNASDACYRWGKFFTLKVIYKNYNNAARTPSANQAAQQKIEFLKAVDASMKKVDFGSEYSTADFPIAGAEGTKVRKFLSVGTVGFRHDVIFIKRNSELWEISIDRPMRWTFDEDAAARILASTSFASSSTANALPSLPAASKAGSANYFEIAKSLAAKGDHPLAVVQYTEAVKTDPNNGLIYSYRALSHYHLGNLDAAIKDYDTIIRLNTDLTEAYFGRGTINYEKKYYAAAISDFDKTLTFDSKYYRAFYNRGLAYFRLNQTDKAVADFSKTIELNPNHINSYIQRADIYCSQKMILSAIKDEDKAIALGGKIASRCGKTVSK